MDIEKIEIEETPVETKPRKKKRKKVKSSGVMIIIGIVILLVIAEICVFLKYANTMSLNITAHYPSISSGKNPDGSPFDVSEILCEEVLQRTSEKLDGKIDVETLREHLSVVDNFTTYDLAQLQKNIEEGNTDYTYFPNMYTVTYTIVSEGHRNNGIIDSLKSVIKQTVTPGKKKILDSLAESFKEYYDEKYVTGTVALEIDWSKADSLDYYNQATKTKNYAERISRFLLTKYNDASEYSAASGKGYGDLYTEVEQLISLDVNDYISYVIQNGLTEDKASLIRQFNFMEDINNEDNLREMAEYEVSTETIEIYDPNTTRMVFIPALDDERTFYMNRTKVGIDYLYELASESKLFADDAIHNVYRYNYLQQQFSVIPEPPKASYETADKMYDEIKTKLNAIIEEAKEVTTDDSQNNQKEVIVIGKTYRDFQTVSMIKYGAEIFIMMFITAFLIFSLIGVLKKPAKKAKKEVEENVG